MNVLLYLKKIIPGPLFSLYHYAVSLISALVYRFPSRRLFVIGVTGTKGKTTVVELINAILEEAGYVTAVSNTLRFKIGNTSTRNLYKMTMPGRFFLQKFFHDAEKSGCTHAVLEMTSEGVKQYRHMWIALDVLVFTNLSPEHIEAHGSYEKYRDAKLALARALERSPKKDRRIVVNADDKEAGKFLAANVPHKHTFSLHDAKPYRTEEDSVPFAFKGVAVHSPLTGEFNLSNILAATVLADALGIPIETIKRAVETFKGVEGRVEEIRVSPPFGKKAKQSFRVIVDYAHTPDSLRNIYGAFAKQKKICVLGAAGGGRDTWKRKEMGRIAHVHCHKTILTNEDPYDEDPRKILEDIREGFPKSKRARQKLIVELDRRTAIRKALELAKKDDIVLITGKGTDPYIMGPKGTKTPWDDRRVTREELKKLLFP